MASAQRIQIPNLDPKFVRDRNPEKNWVIDQFRENISTLDGFAGNLPLSLTWHTRTAEQFKEQVTILYNQNRYLDADALYWRDMLDQVQAFGLLSAWRLTELISSAVWAIRRNDPLCAAIMARAALETSASYAWFQTRMRQSLASVIGKNEFIAAEILEDELLKTLWASRAEDVEQFYNPTNIVTIIGHLTKKIPHHEEVSDFYSILCEVAHPNMLGRSIYLSNEDGKTVISRKRGASTKIIEHASLFALSWAAGTLPRSITVMQDICLKTSKDRERFHAKIRSGWTPPLVPNA